jgi:hypothetical protein
MHFVVDGTPAEKMLAVNPRPAININHHPTKETPAFCGVFSFSND